MRVDTCSNGILQSSAFPAYQSVPFLQPSPRDAAERDVSAEYDISAIGSHDRSTPCAGQCPISRFRWACGTRQVSSRGSPRPERRPTRTRDACIADSIERNRFEDGSSSVGIRRDIV